MILTIDTGNTRTKWAVFNEANAIVGQGVCNNTDLKNAPPEWANCSLAVISNVAGEAAATKLKTMLGAMPQHWVSALEQGFGITNAYTQATQLGSDRWAAMVGARQYTEQSCLVVNAGTALTIDALQREADGTHQFIGGMILPGWHLMQAALLQGTSGIDHALKMQGAEAKLLAEHDVDFPCNTADALYIGSLLAMSGAIEQMSLRLQRRANSSIQCMISGGDAPLLSERLRGGAAVSDIVVIEDLVLRGLLVIGREIR